MLKLKALVKNWIPPIALHAMQSLRSPRIVFEGDFASWEEAAVKCSGYDADNILAKVLDATLKVKRGEAIFERDSVLFDKTEYAWPVLAGLMCAASRSNGVLNVLDFGGALGSSYFQNRMFLKDLPEVRWNVVEQAHYVKAGQEHIQDKHLRFYSTIDACVEENRPNVVLLSSVLQYMPDTTTFYNDICALGCGTIILDRIIVNSTESDRIYVQHVPSSIYLASYPCRSLSEKHLINSISKNYKLKASFDSLSFPALSFIKSEFKGYIFHKEYL